MDRRCRTAIGLTLLLAAAACAGSDVNEPPAKPVAVQNVQKAEPKLIGDGSTAYTGRQKTRWKPAKLEPGQRPPQFVVLSWDGAGATGGVFSRFRALAKKHNASMTFFLSGIYTLPESKRHLYKGPGHPRGKSDIGFFSKEAVHETIRNIGLAWREGHEIGTHFNGHFCGPNGVNRWSTADWQNEIEQAVDFVGSWKTNTGFKDLPPLPFDYRKELAGARTPCLEGRHNLQKAARKLGWEYDSSGTGQQVWPKRRGGLWDIPLQFIPMPGRDFEVLAMDYNLLANQSKAKLNGSPERHASWRRQADGAFRQGFLRAYRGNRAPLIIGNHFENWNGGIYMDAVQKFIEDAAPLPEVRFVSFRQLVRWLELQDPKVLAKLRTLSVGKPPKTGWTKFLSPPRDDLPE